MRLNFYRNFYPDFYRNFILHRPCLVRPLLLLLLAWMPVATALQVTGLYDHRVAVGNESDAERNRAFREALEAVILKVSGKREWLTHPLIEEALDNAQSYVEGISYSSETISPAASPGVNSANPLLTPVMEQRFIEVNFADALIDGLLAGANIPVWDDNRPSVLVWMALQDAQGERTMLTRENNPHIVSYMEDFAARRALPVIFPVLDFEDRRNLSEDALWRLEEQAIKTASARYDADSILAGRLHFTAGGELVGLWQFIFQDEAEVFDGFDRELEAYLDMPLDRITNQLADYFAIAPETATQQMVRLRVEGIGDLNAYSALISYVSNLGLVDSVSIAALDGERLELELGLVGNPEQLFELIALDRDLLPIQDTRQNVRDGGRDVLHYRWTR